MVVKVRSKIHVDATNNVDLSMCDLVFIANSTCLLCTEEEEEEEEGSTA